MSQNSKPKCFSAIPGSGDCVRPSFGALFGYITIPQINVSSSISFTIKCWVFAFGNRRHRPTPQEVRADAPDHRLAKCAICINTYELPKGRHLGAGIETECEAGPMADAIALSEGISWPLDAVRMRILDELTAARFRSARLSAPGTISVPYCDRLPRASVENSFMRTRSGTVSRRGSRWRYSSSCVRINLLRTHCAELNGSTAIFVNVTVGSDRDDHTAVPSISGSAGLYAGAACHSE